MKVTPQLKTWLVDNAELPEDAEDDAVKAAAAAAMVDGKLEGPTYVELTTEKEAKQHDQLTTLLETLSKSQAEISKRLEQIEKPEEKATKASPVEKAMAKTGDVTVKGAWEQYGDNKTVALYPNQTKTGGKHSRAGQVVTEGMGPNARTFDVPSQRELAMSGVYLKWLLSAQGKSLPSRLRFQGDAKNPTGETHDEQLLLHALHRYPWMGAVGDGGEVKNRLLHDHEVKQVIDDTTSGGQEITPIFFDEQVILPTLLHGELFPRVNVVPIARGSRIESGTIGEITTNSGGGDGTDVTLTTTTGFITAFNTTIFVGDGGIELGLDFLSDTPVDLAGILTRQFGEKMMEWLDDQIAAGDGTTEPEGVVNATGTTSVSHSAAAPTVAIYEEHLLTIGKEFTAGTPTDRVVYCGTQTSYRRARAIAVGAADTRLVFGMDLDNYSLFGHPYAINANQGNANIWCGNLARYRMYRRLGLQVVTSTEGTDLVRANKMLMVGRWRFGGQVETGSAFSLATDGQA